MFNDIHEITMNWFCLKYSNKINSIFSQLFLLQVLNSNLVKS